MNLIPLNSNMEKLRSFKGSRDLIEAIPDKDTRGQVETVLVLSHHVDPNAENIHMPHLNALMRSNPEVEIYPVDLDSVPRLDNTRESVDRQLRGWWKKNSLQVPGEIFAVCEWDVCITCPLPRLPEDYDLVGRWVFRENPEWRKGRVFKNQDDVDWTPDAWWWWSQIPALGLKENEAGVGIVPFAFMVMRRSVLDNLILPKWDRMYEANVMCELRFAVVSEYGGSRLGRIDLPYCECMEEQVNWIRFGVVPGIYHPVKK